MLCRHVHCPLLEFCALDSSGACTSVIYRRGKLPWWEGRTIVKVQLPWWEGKTIVKKQQHPLYTRQHAFYLLPREDQAILVRLRTGHCRFRPHTCSSSSILVSLQCAPLNTCCRTCPTHQQLQAQTWPADTPVRVKLYGPLPGFLSTAAFARVCLLVGCLNSQQQASVSQGRICSDNFTCCHTQIEVADPTFYLTQSQYTDTGPTSPSADPITPGAWQGSHWSANF